MRLVFTLLFAGLLALAANGAQYRLDWSVVSCGGGPAVSASFRADGTAGQSAAGFVQGASLLHWVGFWAGEAPAPVVASSPAAAKLLQDGTLVSVAGTIATSATGDFEGLFYIEDPGRSSGIRVAASPSSIPALARGSVLNVIGTMSSTPDGERQLSGPIVVVVSTSVPLTPLGMNNCTLGGASFGTPPAGQAGVTRGIGTNSIGLLVRTWGRVGSAGPGFVQVDDGSGPVTVDTSTLAVPPSTGSYVTVIGIGSLYLSGSERLRLLLPRNDSDIVPM